jgi:hypothetical protein
MESYLYQYGVGGLVFAAGIALGVRAGQLGWADRRPRRRLLALVAGLVYFAALQGALLVWGH